MKIKDYLNKGKLSRAEFALRCGISIPTLYRIMLGKKTMRGTALMIAEATGHRVTVEEILEEYRPSDTKIEVLDDR